MKAELLYWFYFFLYSFFTACGLVMWDYCMTGSQRLLTFYKVWLLQRALRRGQGKAADLKLWQSINIQHIPGETEKGINARIYAAYIAKLEMIASPYIFWEKPLGLCTTCFTPYIAVTAFFFFGLQSNFEAWYTYSYPVCFFLLTNFLFQKIK